MKRGESDAGVVHPFTQVAEASPFLGRGDEGRAGGVGDVTDVAEGKGGGLEGGGAALPWQAAVNAPTATIRVVNLRTCGSERLERDRKDTDRTPPW